MRKNFRTYQLAIEFYHLSRNLSLPRHLRDQLDRAASSVVLNLSEGSGRYSRKEQKRFFDIAFGSLRESQAILDLKFAPEHPTAIHADKLAASLFCLIKAVAREI